MLFNRQIKVSERFGEDYIYDIIEYLKPLFNIEFIEKKEIDMDLNYYDYNINGMKVSFLSEGQVGTFIIGKKRIVKDILNQTTKNKCNLFELIVKPRPL